MQPTSLLDPAIKDNLLIFYIFLDINVKKQL